MNLMEEEDGGRWNIADNTYNGDTWLRITNKHWVQNIDSLFVYSVKHNQHYPLQVLMIIEVIYLNFIII